MDLYLVRHAVAEKRDPERWSDDSLRPLSQAGTESFHAASQGVLRIGAEVEAVLASSFVRAWSTAEILTQEAAWPDAEALSVLEPPSPASAVAEAIRPRSESSLALVGHQPQLSELASLLLGASEQAVRLELKKGGIIHLRFPDRPMPGAGVLRWSAGPRILSRLGR